MVLIKDKPSTVNGRMTIFLGSMILWSGFGFFLLAIPLDDGSLFFGGFAMCIIGFIINGYGIHLLNKVDKYIESV